MPFLFFFSHFFARRYLSCARRSSSVLFLHWYTPCWGAWCVWRLVCTRGDGCLPYLCTAFSFCVRHYPFFHACIFHQIRIDFLCFAFLKFTFYFGTFTDFHLITCDFFSISDIRPWDFLHCTDTLICLTVAHIFFVFLQHFVLHFFLFWN